jgi:uncharacterized protein with PQ loop repeat
VSLGFAGGIGSAELALLQLPSFSLFLYAHSIHVLSTLFMLQLGHIKVITSTAKISLFGFYQTQLSLTSFRISSIIPIHQTPHALYVETSLLPLIFVYVCSQLNKPIVLVALDRQKSLFVFSLLSYVMSNS